MENKKTIVRLTEEDLHNIIKDAVNEALKKKSPLHYWAKSSKCPECGKEEGNPFYGGLCPDCAKGRNKANAAKV